MISRAQEADVEARIEREEADQRERAAEIRRDEKKKKVNYMKTMEDGIEVRTRALPAGCEECV